MLNGLDLFSGIGGLTLALGEWVAPVAYCEYDGYAQGILLSRMADGRLPEAPIWPDVRTLVGESLPVPIDIIYGGFPCQDISVAGNGAGLEGERSGLFFEICRLIDEIKPPFVFLENVPAIRTRGGERVVKELARRGYDCRWDVVSAAEVGAPHLRKRWFLLAAHAERLELREQSRGVSGPSGQEAIQFTSHGVASWSPARPSICGMDDGLPFRVDRLRGLGNAVVPPQAREAFMRLMGLKREVA